METATLLSAQQWAEQTFGDVELGDQRREQRAVKMAAAMAADPGACLPQQRGSEGQAQAAYRFLQTPQISDEQVIGPHVQQTRAAMSEAERVLLIQDSTEVDDQPHPSTSGLGAIGNGSHQGFLLQTVLAVEPESRQVLGIAPQEPFLRQPAPAGETKWQGEQRSQRESQVWERSVRAIGNAPPAVQWIQVGDRASDMLPFLRACLDEQGDCVVRACADRCVDLLVEQEETPVAPRSHHKVDAAHPGAQHLFEVAASGPVQGERDLELEATKTSPARTAQLAIRFGRVRLLPPRQQEKTDRRPLVVDVVRVWEPQAAEGVTPLAWLLLTAVPVRSVEQAWQRVEWYRARWLVEEYQQGLKSGCRIQERQLQTYEGLRRRLAFLAPLAVRLLHLRAASRQDPQQRAVAVLPAEVVAVVAAKVGLPVVGFTAQQCWYAIARLGGYVARCGDGPPGWKTLWRGWLQVQTLLEGVQLAARLTLDHSTDP